MFFVCSFVAFVLRFFKHKGHKVFFTKDTRICNKRLVNILTTLKGTHPMKKLIACLTIFVALTVCAQAQVTDSVEKDLGFKSLFNGKNLDGWLDGNDQYEVLDDGSIRCKPTGGGNLYTKYRFANYIFRFDVKMTANANNGVGIRTELVGDPSFTAGKEIQILDDSGSDYTNLAPYQYHGSIYGVVPAKQGHLKPLGEWNVEEITAKGTKITVTLNGVTIVDADLAEFKDKPLMDGKVHPGLFREKGFIGFLGHNDPVRFRSIRIKSLDEK